MSPYKVVENSLKSAFRHAFMHADLQILDSINVTDSWAIKVAITFEVAMFIYWTGPLACLVLLSVGLVE